jgi:predicted DNA-binding ribbon-helix-helix protein
MNKTDQSQEKVVFSIYLTKKVCGDLDKMAARENTTRTALIRKIIDKALSIESYQENIDFLTGIIRQEIKAESSKQANRLAAMLFKVGIITSANYFLAVKMLADVISPSMQEDFKDINTNARKLGIDYMKQSGVGVVEFLEDEDAVERAVGKIKTDFSEV